jgi:hypothetical protein
MDDEALDDPSSHEGVRHFVDVGEGDVPVGNVLRLDDDGRAGLAEVETARGADPHEILGPALHDRLLETDGELLRAFLGAGPLGVVVGTAVRAHEQISLAMGHSVQR